MSNGSGRSQHQRRRQKGKRDARALHQAHAI
jgi:hypothetical protein